MAQLNLARAEGLGGFERLVAIKMIHEHLRKEHAFVQMFLDEARIAARIHHPHVVAVHEIGEHAGRHYIVMDYVSGETLAALLVRSSKGRPIPIPIAAHLLATAAEALHAAHELVDGEGRPLGVVHRDVSPQNMIIGYDGLLRIVDFGVAKAASRLGHTKPGSQKGEYPCMAPEQLQGGAVDRRTDVFALGVVLWEVLTGKRLFRGATDGETVLRVMTLKVAPPSSHRDEVSGDLDAIVLRALEREVSGRQATARELAFALRDFIATHSRFVTSADVETYMAEIFSDRREQRFANERKALTEGTFDILVDPEEGSLEPGDAPTSAPRGLQPVAPFEEPETAEVGRTVAESTVALPAATARGRHLGLVALAIVTAAIIILATAGEQPTVPADAKAPVTAAGPGEQPMTGVPPGGALVELPRARLSTAAVVAEPAREPTPAKAVVKPR
jgi:serine/threonine-protein kinase